MPDEGLALVAHAIFDMAAVVCANDIRPIIVAVFGVLAMGHALMLLLNYNLPIKGTRFRISRALSK